jgi:hypothetical protein
MATPASVSEKDGAYGEAIPASERWPPVPDRRQGGTAAGVGSADGRKESL